MKYSRHALRLASLFVSSVLCISANAATISGTVYDLKNDIYLESAIVRLQGTDQTTFATRGGRYRLTNVEPGNYSVTASVTGYPQISMPITVEDPYEEITLNLNFSDENVYELDAFVVEGSLIGQAKSLDIRKASAEFKEVVASDAFGQFADRNPAEALQRVAGITLEKDQGEGTFLIIRGGAPEFSAVQIDGVGLATPEEDGRRVNLNVVTVDQLERIEVSKTWTPKQKGNVIGGTVNLITRSALDRGERYGSIEGAVTWRENNEDEYSWRNAITLGDIIDDRDFNWLGDKAIGFQVSVNSSDDFSGSDTANWIWDANRGYPFVTRPGEERLYGYSLTEIRLSDFNINRKRLGASARLEFRLTDNHEFYVSGSHNKFNDVEREQIFTLRATAIEASYAGTSLVTRQLLLQLGQDPDDAFNQLRLSTQGGLTYNEAMQIGELEWDPVTKMFTKGGIWPMPMNRVFSHTDREDSINTYQMGGKHRFGWDIGLNWKAYVSDASQDSIQHFVRFSVDGSSGGGGMSITGIEHPYIADMSGSQVIHNKSSFTLREFILNPSGRQINTVTSMDERKGYDIDLDKEFDLGSTSWTTRIGLSNENRDKEYSIDRNHSGLLQGSLDDSIWPSDRVSLADELFDGGEVEGFEKNFGNGLRYGPGFHLDNTLDFLKNPDQYGANFVQDVNDLTNNFTSQVASNYKATEEINGLYLEQQIVWNKWTLIFGARYEKTENTFTNLAILTRNPDYPQLPFIQPTQWRLLAQNFGMIFADTVTNTKEYDHILPAVHLSYRSSDKSILRASVTKTIARPLFTDLIPREIPDIENGTFRPSIRLPAFDLRPMEAINYDISFDYYIEPIGLFSVAVFYKDLDGPIYDETRIGVGPNDETQIYELRYNSQNARIDPDNIKPTDIIRNDRAYDISRKRNAGKGNLYGIEITFDRKFNFLPHYLNGFGINTNISWFESEAELLTDRRNGEKVPLFKQPDMAANFSLYYEKHGIFARLSYNVRGKYLNSVSGGTTLIDALEDEIQQPLNSMDIYFDKTARLDFTLRYKVTDTLQVFAEIINLTNEPELRYRGQTYRPNLKEYTQRIFTVGVKWNL